MSDVTNVKTNWMILANSICSRQGVGCYYVTLLINLAWVIFSCRPWQWIWLWSSYYVVFLWFDW